MEELYSMSENLRHESMFVLRQICDSWFETDRAIIQFANNTIDKIIQKRIEELEVLKQGSELYLEIVKKSSAETKTKTPIPINMECPNCKDKIIIDSRAKKVVCPSCGVLLEAEEDQTFVEKKGSEI